MQNWKDFYGSSYLTAKSLGKRKIRGPITSVGPEDIIGKDGTTTTRLVIYVKGHDTGIPLNKTNAERLAKKFGDNFAKWKGKIVAVSVTKVQFAGKDTDGLLIVPG